MKVVWAIDPFEGEEAIWMGAERLLASLQRRIPVEILPVHVFSSHELELAADMLPAWTIQYLPKVEACLKEFVSQRPLTRLAEPQVIVQSSSSHRQSAEALSRFAERNDADAIVLATRARTGMARFFTGSFSEALVTHCTVPLLVAHRDDREVVGGSILFATDLSPEGVLDETIELARALGSRLVIAHVRQLPVEPFFRTTGFAGLPFYEYEAEDSDARRETLAGYVDRARAAGVEAEAELIETSPSVPEALIHCAERHGASLVAMASRTGGVAAALIGSVTRQVVRHARCPVMVMHPGGRVRRGARETAA